MKNARSGFTLMEFIIAIGLSTLVFVALIEVMVAMVRTQFQATLQGTVTGFTLLSLQQINTDISQATRLEDPNPNALVCGGAASHLSGVSNSKTLKFCSNYSKLYGGVVDPSSPIKGYLYCVTSDHTLWRYVFQGAGACDPVPTQICGNAPPVGASGNVVVYKNFLIKDGNNYWVSYSSSGVTLDYAIGESTGSSSQSSIPIYQNMHMSVNMTKSYQDNCD